MYNGLSLSSEDINWCTAMLNALFVTVVNFLVEYLINKENIVI